MYMWKAKFVMLVKPQKNVQCMVVIGYICTPFEPEPYFVDLNRAPLRLGPTERTRKVYLMTEP